MSDNTEQMAPLTQMAKAIGKLDDAGLALQQAATGLREYKDADERGHQAMIDLLGTFVTEEQMGAAIVKALDGRLVAPETYTTHEGMIVLREEATGDLWLTEEAGSTIQSVWEHYAAAAPQTIAVFDELIAKRRFVTPFAWVGDFERLIVCQIGASGLVMRATQDEFDDRANDLVALLIPTSEDLDDLPLFSDENKEPVAVGSHNVVGLVFTADATTNGSASYINKVDQPVDGWYFNGKSATLSVDLPYKAAIKRVSIEVHEPDERLYDLSTGTDYIRVSAGRYELEFADGPMVGTFEIDTLGNTLNNWTGIKRVWVEAWGESPVDVIVPPVTITPVDPDDMSYQSGDPSTEGAELMGNEFFHNAFRVPSKIKGTQERTFSTQKEFDQLVANPSTAKAKYTGLMPMVLVDLEPRDHHIEITCDTLKSVITNGRVEVVASNLVSPNAPANMVCIGSDCLLTLPDKAIKTGWAIFLWMNQPGERIENCVWQGGRPYGTGRGGLERVMGGASAWIATIFPDLYEEHGAWPLNSKNCGIQAVVSVDGDADTLQTISHFWKLGWPEPPHGPVYHEGTFAHGCVGLVTPAAQKIHGIGEQFGDGKAGEMFFRHCLMSGYIQNHNGDNSAHGDCIGTHYQMEKLRAYGCVFHSQRGVEIGSGSDNLVEQSLFLPPIDGYRILAAAGQSPSRDSGMYHAVAYRDESVGGLALETELELRDCVFGGSPIVSDVVVLTRPEVFTGQAAARRLGQYAVPYGVNAEIGGIWHTG